MAKVKRRGICPVLFLLADVVETWDLDLDFAARAAATAFCEFSLKGSGGGVPVGESFEAEAEAGEKDRPVKSVTVLRTVWLRQRIVRQTRAGLLCQLNPNVPTTRTTSRVLTTRNGDNVRASHRGVRARILRKSVVSAGRVLAEVAVVCVLKYSVNVTKGSRRISQFSVNVYRVCRISSRDLRCGGCEPARFLEFLLVVLVSDHTVLERGLYLLPHIPSTNAVTRTSGPHQRRMLEP